MLSPPRTQLPISAPVAKAREPVLTSTSNVPVTQGAISMFVGAGLMPR